MAATTETKIPPSTNPIHHHRPALTRRVAVDAVADGLHHPTLAEIDPGEAQPHPVGIEGGAAEQIGLPPRVVHHQMGGGMAVDNQPVAGSLGPIDGASMDVAAGHQDATDDLLLDLLEVAGLHQPGADAVLGEGLQLSVGVGGVATDLLLAVYDDKLLHHLQVGVIAIGAQEGAGPEGLQEHGATGREAGAIALAQLGGIALLEIGHTPPGGLAWRLPLAPSTDGLPPPPGDGGLAGVGVVHQSAASALRRRRSPASLGTPGFT